jgi:sigma-B regulation protein RsbU (phosphoserine phosphatase)
MVHGERRADPSGAGSAVSAGPERRVLVVDDSATQRRLVAARIRPLGYRVEEAASGDEALERLRHDPVPLVISDWMMPGLSGPELCRAIREMQNDLYIYVVLLTARRGANDVIEGLGAGADDFMSKPVDEGELLARLTAGWRRIEIQAELVRRNQKLADAYSRLSTLYERIDSDLRAAAALQREFLPEPHAVLRGAEIAGHCRFSGHIGGDHVGYFPAGERQLGLYSIDVSGHGVASALVAIRLAQHFNPRDLAGNIAFETGTGGARRARPPHEVVTDLNRRFLAGDTHDLYFTIAYGLLDLVSGALSLCQAGHAPAAILSPQGRVRFASLGGPPVGLIPDAEFRTDETRLVPGERLLLYSDGITEAVAPDGTMLGEAGFTGILARHAGRAFREFLPRVLAEIDASTGGPDYADDLSVVTVEMPDSAQEGRLPRQRGTRNDPPLAQAAGSNASKCA